MSDYRKKPVVIQAVQWIGKDTDAAQLRTVGLALHEGAVERLDGGIEIRTLEGTMLASVGDWIIKGVKGEVYPCKPDIFAATYELADTPPDPPLSAGGEGALREAAVERKHPDCIAIMCGRIDCGKPGPCYEGRDTILLQQLRQMVEHGFRSPGMSDEDWADSDYQIFGGLRLEHLRTALYEIDALRAALRASRPEAPR